MDSMCLCLLISSMQISPLFFLTHAVLFTPFYERFCIPTERLGEKHKLKTYIEYQSVLGMFKCLLV